MAYPIAYDVLLRVEVEAKDEAAALQMISDDIAQLGMVPSGIQTAFSVIRDDNAFPPKDYTSRHVNGFAVFDADQKKALLNSISAALVAAEAGDISLGNALLDKLARQFEYLNNSTLAGIQL